jgi:hypothetical protein
MNIFHTSLLIRFCNILFLPNGFHLNKHPVSALRMNILERSGHHTLLLSLQDNQLLIKSQVAMSQTASSNGRWIGTLNTSLPWRY